MRMASGSRRRFIGSAAGMVLAASGLSRAKAEAPGDGVIRFGLIADVHQDIMHDAEERLGAFVQDMKARKAQVIVNLGDFCVPDPKNDRFLSIWKSFGGSNYHVIGNHDTDGGYRREETVEYYGSPGRYFSKDEHGVHWVVLDGNDPDGKPGYPCNVNDEQLEWLASDLSRTGLPTLVFIHQPIDAYDQHVRSARKVRAVLAEANREAGFRKVMAVFSGHAHLDYVKESDGIPHVQINSASYQWIGMKHANYPAEILEKHPWIASTCPYDAPLWASVALDCEAGEIRIEGREAGWVGPDPWELGIPEDEYQRSRELCRPAISSRVIPG